MSAKYLPANCKNVKLNLSGAYRTTVTHLVAGDMIRVEFRLTDGETLIQSATHAPARSFWTEVKSVTKVGRQVVVVTGRGTMTDFPHTSVTRQERDEELQARCDASAAAREESITASLLEVFEAKKAEAVDLLNVIPCNDCTGNADNHSFTQGENGAVVVLCIGVAPATVAARKATGVHNFRKDPTYYNGIKVCTQMVARPNGFHAVCGEPEDSPVHGPAAYLAAQAVRFAAATSMRQAPAKVLTHDFDGQMPKKALGGGFTYTLCSQMVERPDGSMDGCAEPIGSPIHDPAGYLEFTQALRDGLGKLRGTPERPIPLTEIALGIQAITEEAATLTAECERCDWTATKTWDQGFADAALDRHVRETHLEDIQAEAEELKALRQVAVRYATLVDALTSAQIGARQVVREIQAEGRDPLSSTAVTRMNAFDEMVAIADKVAGSLYYGAVPISTETRANLTNIQRRLDEGDALRRAVDRALENAKGRRAEASARSWEIPSVRQAYMRAEAAINALEDVNLWASRG